MRSGLLHLVIPSEDPLGDTVRDRVANEWRVLLRLSEISREVCGLGASSKQQEDVILQRRLEYISHMPTKQLHTTQSCIGHSRAHATPQSKTVVLTTKTSYLSSAAAATALGDSREVDYGCAGTYSLKVRACSGSSGGALIARIHARRITYVTERSRPSRIHPRDWSNIRERWRTRCRVLSIVLRDWRQTRKKICERVFDSTRRTKSESTRPVGRRRQVFWNKCHLTSIFRRPENIIKDPRQRGPIFLTTAQGDVSTPRRCQSDWDELGAHIWQISCSDSHATVHESVVIHVCFTTRRGLTQLFTRHAICGIYTNASSHQQPLSSMRYGCHTWCRGRHVADTVQVFAIASVSHRYRQVDDYSPRMFCTSVRLETQTWQLCRKCYSRKPGQLKPWRMCLPVAVVEMKGQGGA
jgi:hypothetical protein